MRRNQSAGAGETVGDAGADRLETSYGFTHYGTWWNIDRRLIKVIEPIAGRRPSRTVFVLGSRDGDYVALIAWLKAKGVECVLRTPGDVSDQLFDLIGDRNVLE